MPSLNYFLDRTEQSIRSIQSLKFRSPGIFTNAIVKRPNITILLKDPTIDESSLYKIVKPTLKKRRITNKKGKSVVNEYIGVKPERVDGKSVYVDKSFSEIEQQSGQDTNINNDDADVDVSNKRSIVQIPELIDIPSEPVYDHSSSPTKRGITYNNHIYNPHQGNSYFNISPSSNDIDKLIERTNKLIHKYPTLIKNQAEVLAKLSEYQDKYDELAGTIKDLEHDINKQRKQLNILNINYSDIGSPVKEGSQLIHNDEESYDNDNDDEEEDSGNEPEEDFDVDEYIRKEEQEIEQLEQQLNQRQRI